MSDFKVGLMLLGCFVFFMLVIRYGSGKDTSQGNKKAIEWYQKAMALGLLGFSILVGTPSHADNNRYCSLTKFSYKHIESPGIGDDWVLREVTIDYPEGSIVQGVMVNMVDVPGNYNNGENFLTVTHSLDSRKTTEYTLVVKYVGEYYDCSWKIAGVQNSSKAKPKKFSCDQIEIMNTSLSKQRNSLMMNITVSFPPHVQYVSSTIGNSPAEGTVIPGSNVLSINQFRKTRASKFSIFFLDSEGTTHECKGGTVED